MRHLALSPRQVRAVHDLWDRLADFPAAESDAALRHLKEKLCGWLRADGAFWAGVVRIAGGGAGRKDRQNGWRIRAVVNLKPTAHNVALAKRRMREQDTDPPMTARAITADGGSFRVRTNHDGLVDMSAFRRTAHFRTFYAEAGIKDRMWAAFPVNRDTESYLAIDRIGAARRFSPADVALASYTLRGIKWFHRQLLLSHGLPIAKEALEPAQRRILLHLLGKRTEKEIAAALGLAPGSAHQYAVEVYRKLGVSGRAGLVSLWLS